VIIPARNRDIGGFAVRRVLPAVQRWCYGRDVMSDGEHNRTYWSGNTEYERYLRTSQLLELQKPVADRAHPDELLFQTMHQVEELWMKVAVQDVCHAIDWLGADRMAETQAALARACRLLETVEHNMKLFETMLPSAYLAIRAQLGSGSGLDSPGYNRINELAPPLWAAFEAALKRADVDLLAMYEQPETQPAHLVVAEALINFDAAMMRFKREHLMVVKRIIGMGTASLRGGNPVDMLERSANVSYFPMLWAVRDRMFIDFKQGPPVE